MCRKPGQQLSNFYSEDDSISQKSVTRDSDSEKSETRVHEIRAATTSTMTSADSPKEFLMYRKQKTKAKRLSRSNEIPLRVKNCMELHLLETACSVWNNKNDK